LSGWWSVGGVSTCGHPAVYRLAGHLEYLGGCAGDVNPQDTINLAVGQTFDLHLTTEGAGGPPDFALPTSSDTSVLTSAGAQDAATGTYRAVAPGLTTLVTSGPFCPQPLSVPCVLARIEVVAPGPSV
jgi:hypothetical protein